MTTVDDDLRFQAETATEILFMAEEDGHECDLTHSDLLDYMGILGVSFARSGDASKAYIDGLAR